MVSCIGPLATTSREPQARKGAAAAVDSGAGMWLVQDATKLLVVCQEVDHHQQTAYHSAKNLVAPCLVLVFVLQAVHRHLLYAAGHAVATMFGCGITLEYLS